MQTVLALWFQLTSYADSQCFAGLTQEELGKWLYDPILPETVEDVWKKQTVRIAWEVVFMLCTSCIVIAIITVRLLLLPYTVTLAQD